MKRWDLGDIKKRVSDICFITSSTVALGFENRCVGLIVITGVSETNPHFDFLVYLVWQFMLEASAAPVCVRMCYSGATSP